MLSLFSLKKNLIDSMSLIGVRNKLINISPKKSKHGVYELHTQSFLLKT